MNIFSVIAPILGIGIGFIISNFCLYIWSVESVIAVHRWGFVVISFTITSLVLKYLFNNHLLANYLVQSRYEKRKLEVNEREKKLDIRQYNLNSLYNKHRVYQEKIEHELHRKSQLNADLKRRLLEVEKLISEIQQALVMSQKGINNEGQLNRQRKKIEKIIQNAESIKNGGIQ